MSDFIEVANIKEISENQAKIIEHNEKQIAIFNINGNFYAISNVCLHRGGPIGEGFVNEFNITCPLHGWQYDLKTGQCNTAPGAKLETYQLKVEGDKILISAQ